MCLTIPDEGSPAPEVKRILVQYHPARNNHSAAAFEEYELKGAADEVAGPL